MVAIYNGILLTELNEVERIALDALERLGEPASSVEKIPKSHSFHDAILDLRDSLKKVKEIREQWKKVMPPCVNERLEGEDMIAWEARRNLIGGIDQLAFCALHLGLLFERGNAMYQLGERSLKAKGAASKTHEENNNLRDFLIQRFQEMGQANPWGSIAEAVSHLLQEPGVSKILTESNAARTVRDWIASFIEGSPEKALPCFTEKARSRFRKQYTSAS